MSGSDSGKDVIPTWDELLSWYYDSSSSKEMAIVVEGVRHVLVKGQTEIISHELFVGTLDSDGNLIFLYFPNRDSPPLVNIEKREDIDNMEVG